MQANALDIDANRSVWIDPTQPYEPQPPLSGNAVADVAVIGGGFTGVSAAYHISRRFPDRRVVLLEARVLGNGASGRNGGQMLNWVAGHETSSPDQAIRVWSSTKAAIEGVGRIIERHGLNAAYRVQGCLQVATHSARAEEAHAMVEKLRSWGLPLRWLQGAELSDRLRLAGAVGAVLDPTEGQLDGLAYLRALRPVLLQQGVGIHENSPVLSIREGREIELETPHGQLRAKALVLGTDGYTPRLGYFRGGICPLHSHALATEPVSPDEAVRIGFGTTTGFADDQNRISYGGLTPRGQFLFGGGSNAAYSYLFGNRTQFPGSPESASSAFSAIERQLRGYFPEARNLRVSHRWTGTLGLTLSRVCSMGVRGQARNVYYALGYSGHGVTLANLAGEVLCDLYSDAPERWRDLPFYQRPLRGIPPEPFRWIGYHVYTRLTGRSPRRSGA